MFSPNRTPIWGEGNGRGISGFAVNRGAVYRGFTVLHLLYYQLCFILAFLKMKLYFSFKAMNRSVQIQIVIIQQRNKKSRISPLRGKIFMSKFVI